MYDVKVIAPFKDVEYNCKLRKVGEEYTIDSDERLLFLMGKNKLKKKCVRLLRSHKKNGKRYNRKQIIMFQDYLYIIGGIETFLFNLTKNFKDKNITVMCRQIEPEQIVAISKYADIEIYEQQKVECDVLILGNYNCDYILNNVKAKKIYQMIHADWSGIKQIPVWSTFTWKKNPRINEIICVSEAAQKGLKETMKYDSKVIYNILDDDYQEEDGLTFITMSRATVEKGIDRIIDMAQRFRAAHKKFIWFLCCSLDQIKDKRILNAIKSIPEFVFIPPSVTNKMLIKNCDYLVQLSDTESFCYAAFEALQRGVPVILTEFPEAKKIVQEGKNGYIIKFDLSNLDIDKIFNHKPANVTYIDRCNKEDWEKVFKGEF